MEKKARIPEAVAGSVVSTWAYEEDGGRSSKHFNDPSGYLKENAQGYDAYGMGPALEWLYLKKRPATGMETMDSGWRKTCDNGTDGEIWFHRDGSLTEKRGGHEWGGRWSMEAGGVLSLELGDYRTQLFMDEGAKRFSGTETLQRVTGNPPKISRHFEVWSYVVLVPLTAPD